MTILLRLAATKDSPTSLGSYEGQDEEFPNDAVSHRNQFPLGFGDFGSLAFDTLNSFGVCAKNSMRDMTG
jgi:hypothetical protein